MIRRAFATGSTILAIWWSSTVIGAPVPAVTSPAAGANLTAGTSTTVRWTIQNQVQPGVDLQYTTNNGVNWYVIASGVSGLSYVWAIPSGINSSSCRVKVITYDAAWLPYTAQSGLFTIGPPCAAPGTFSLSSPSNGASLNPTTSVTLSWGASSGASRYDVKFGETNPPAYLKTVTGTSTTVAVVPGKTYYWFVTSYPDCDQTKQTSTAQRSFGVKPTPVPRVVYPNGGESLQGGQAVTVQWTVQNQINANVDLQYTTDNGATWTTFAAGVSGTTRNWTPPSVTSSQCRVKVITYDGTPTAYTDQSDGVFSIVTCATPGAFSLSSPSNGASLDPTTSATLTWGASSGASRYDVKFGETNPPTYLKTVTGTSTTVAVVPGKTYYWFITSYPDCDQTKQTSTAQRSFGVKPTPVPRVVYPNGGESLQGGQAVTVQWTVQNQINAHVDLQYTTDNGATWTTFAGGVSGTTRSWTPPSVTSSQCRVKVITYDGTPTAYTDQSDGVFSIGTCATPGAFSLSSPSNGASLDPTTSATLTWGASSGASRYDVKFGETNPPTYLKTVTGTSTTVAVVPGKTYYWFITSYPDCDQTKQTSTAQRSFGVKPTPVPRVVYPNGGESLQGGQAVTVQWTVQNQVNAYVDLQYTTDNGATWTTFAAGVSGTTRSWTPPSVTSSQCRVKMITYDGTPTAYTDQSDGVFSIGTCATPGAFSLSSPGNTASLDPTTSATLTWGASSGASRYDVKFGETNPPTYLKTVTGTSTTVAVVPGKTYYWFITSYPDCDQTKQTSTAQRSFGVKPTPVPRVVYPNGGESLQGGQAVTVQWTVQNQINANVDLQYTTDNGATWTTFAGGVSGTTRSWTPPSVTSSQCRVKVITYDGTPTAYTDQSDGVFSIGGACVAPGAFSLSSPSNGASLDPTTSVTLSWGASSGASRYDVKFGETNPPTYLKTVTGTSTVVTVVPGKTYYWFITSYPDCDQTKQTSTAQRSFGVKPTPVPRVVYPNGGESLQGGQAVTVQWTVQNQINAYVDLQYTTDNGATWTTFAGGVSGTTRSWTPPSVTSSQCRVKVITYDGTPTAYTDQSDGVFSIQAGRQTLTVSSTGTGVGVIASDPPGVSCGSTCAAAYAPGASVSLTASPASGSTFAGWGGACSGSSGCRVTMNGSLSVVAEFRAQPQCRNVTILPAPVGSGEFVFLSPRNCSDGYLDGTVVGVRASPIAGFRFVRWLSTAGAVQSPSAPETSVVISASGYLTAEMTLDTSRAPNAAFTWTPSPPRIGEAIRFTDGSLGTPDHWSWDVDGDGTPDGSSRDVFKTFSSAGRRTATLTVWNAYGRDSMSQDFEVVATPSNLPRVTGVRRQLAGFFLSGARLDNRFDVTVDWAGRGNGVVRFSINGGPWLEEPATVSSASHTFRINEDFPSSFSPSTVRIVAVTPEGSEGPVWEEKLWVFPWPSWYAATAAQEVNGVTFGLGAGGGEMRARFGFQIPRRALGTDDRPIRFGPLPTWVPIFGGHRVGLTETYAKASADIYGSGRGVAAISGQTGIEAMGKAIKGRLGAQAEFRLGPSEGLRLTTATGSFGLTGEIGREFGILELIPATSAWARLPGLGFLNEMATLEATLGVNTDFTFSFEPTASGLEFKDGTAEVELELKAVLRIDALPDRISLEGWAAGAGSITFGLREPLLRSAKLGFEAGVSIDIDDLWVIDGFSERKVVAASCEWEVERGVSCSGDGELGDAKPIAYTALETVRVPVRPRRHTYEKFGNLSEVVLHQVGDLSVQKTSVQSREVVSNVFRNASPKLASTKAGQLLIWVYQDPSITNVAQSTDIAWAFAGPDGNFSSTSRVSVDRRAELSPVVGTLRGGKIVAAWLRNRDTAFSEDLNTFDDLPRFYKKLEVVSAVFDPSLRRWSEVTQLTDDEVLDTDLRLSSGPDGHLLLSWIRQPGGRFESSADSPASVVASEWLGESWGAPTAVATGLVGVTEHAAAWGADGPVIVTAQGSSGGSRSGLMLYRGSGGGWTGPEVLAAGAENRTPRLAAPSSGPVQAVWVRGDELVHHVLGSAETRIIRSDSGGVAFHDLALLGSKDGTLALLFKRVATNGPAQLYARLMVGSGGQWSEDLRIDEGADLATGAVGELSADGLQVVYLRSEVSRRSRTVTAGSKTFVVGNVPQIDRTSIVLLDRRLRLDLEAVPGSLILTPALPVPGEALTVSAVARNVGDYSVGRFEISARVGSTLVWTWQCEGGLAAGGSLPVTATFPYPASAGDVIITVDSRGEIPESIESNNTVRTEFANAPPVVVITASATSGRPPLRVEFDATATRDPEGQPVVISWIFGDGSAEQKGARVSKMFERPGRHVVTATARDEAGGVGSGSVTVSVGDIDADGIAVAEAIVPVILDVAGAGDSHYTSEVAITNAGSTEAEVELRYVAADALGSTGTGATWETLSPGKQLVIGDAIAYLRNRGLAIPPATAGPQAGTVRAIFRGLDVPSSAAVTVRTTSAVGLGRAGLSYAGLRPEETNASVISIYGLRQTAADRSNLAVTNGGYGGSISLRIDVISGEGSSAGQTLTSWTEDLGPGQWKQFNQVLAGTGVGSGYAEITRVKGAERFFAYGVINDNGTNDGSFVPPTVGTISGSRLTVPVLVETSAFRSELVLANRGSSTATLTLRYSERLTPSLGSGGTATVQLRPREQQLIPDAIQYLRSKGIAIGAMGAGSYAGALRVSVSGASLSDIFAGARTASPSPAGGQFGLFTPGVYESETAGEDAYVYGLRADATSRSNLAVVNAGSDSDGSLTLEVQVFDGDRGGASAGAPRVISLAPGQWEQITGILGGVAVQNGWVRVRRTAGTAGWLAYGVVNDGGNPGERTGDGAYMPMTTAGDLPPDPPPPPPPPPPSSSEITVTLPGGVPLVLVKIPAGTFQMGSPTTERSRWSDETQHPVTLMSDYYVGKYEVTQAQWQAVMGTAMSTICGSYGTGGSYPVYCVTWDDIRGTNGFIAKLNQLLGATKFRLPTEAEWERAARGGTQTRFSFGDALDGSDDCGANAAANPYVWWCANAGNTTHAVGTKAANAYGVYDMHGNVWEWVEDWYGTYPSTAQTNPPGPTTGSGRVYRGGGWGNYLQYTRSAGRYDSNPAGRGAIGFRLARSQ